MRKKIIVFLGAIGIVSIGIFLVKKLIIEKDTLDPNILILMSDNQEWDHLGCYGDPVLHTPNIDKLAQKGIRFSNAYCSCPSCAPSRAAMLTGQDFWRLEEGANLWGILPKKFKVYTDILETDGYFVGFEGKGWGPGNFEAGGRKRNPAGDKYDSFKDFLKERKDGRPFCYWFSSHDPHRPYTAGDTTGIDLSRIKVPSYLPNVEEVKEDIRDYYAEVQNFDKDIGAFIQTLKDSDELKNTLLFAIYNQTLCRFILN